VSGFADGDRVRVCLVGLEAFGKTGTIENAHNGSEIVDVRLDGEDGRHMFNVRCLESLSAGDGTRHAVALRVRRFVEEGRPL
jgi:hypothetical protein